MVPTARVLVSFALALSLSTSASGSAALPACGDVEAPPFASEQDADVQRPCSVKAERAYKPRNSGVAFAALDIESEHCFVPDEAYRLLDDVIDEAALKALETAPSHASMEDRAAAIGKATGDVLESRGFRLWIPTETLGDALTSRSQPNETPRHTTDCDTSSLILMAVAEKVGLPASLVEVTLDGGAGHNFVRWPRPDGKTVEWDMNGRGLCEIAPGSPSYQGQSMTDGQLRSYLIGLRGQVRAGDGDLAGALADSREAIAMFPEHPVPYNTFVWLVATKDFSGRDRHRDEALGLARRMVELTRSPGYLDTAACMFAHAGDFATAAQLQREAVAGAPDVPELAERLGWFVSADKRDCTGVE